MFCSKCGNNVPDNVQFCTNCGNQMNANNQAPTQQAAPVQQPYYSQPVAPYVPERPMKWFKFLIYFSLFAGALVNLVMGFRLLSGGNYGSSYIADLVYGYFSGLKAIDIIVGILFIVVAGFMVFVRFQLAGFKANGPKLFLLLYAVNAAVSVIYSVGVIVVCKSSSMSYLTDEVVSTVIASCVTQVIVSVVMIIVNKIYFDKRKDLFVK